MEEVLVLARGVGGILVGPSLVLEVAPFMLSGKGERRICLSLPCRVQLLPVGYAGVARELVYVLFCSTRYGWGWNSFLKEANEGVGMKMPGWLRNYMRFFVPVVLLTILVVGLIDIFG